MKAAAIIGATFVLAVNGTASAARSDDPATKRQVVEALVVGAASASPRVNSKACQRAMVTWAKAYVAGKKRWTLADVDRAAYDGERAARRSPALRACR